MGIRITTDRKQRNENLERERENRVLLQGERECWRDFGG